MMVIFLGLNVVSCLRVAILVTPKSVNSVDNESLFKYE